MTTKEMKGQPQEQTKRDLAKLRSDWFNADIEEGFKKIERGAYRTVEINENNKTFRTIE